MVDSLFIFDRRFWKRCYQPSQRAGEDWISERMTNEDVLCVIEYDLAIKANEIVDELLRQFFSSLGEESDYMCRGTMICHMGLLVDSLYH